MSRLKKDKVRCRIRLLRGAWRVTWNYLITAPQFNSFGAAQAFLDGLCKGRKPV